MPSSPHSALLITPSIIHHLSHHFQKLCPCHSLWILYFKTWAVVRKMGKWVEWGIFRFFIFIWCNSLWFNSSYPYIGYDSSGSVFFHCTPVNFFSTLSSGSVFIHCTSLQDLYFFLYITHHPAFGRLGWGVQEQFSSELQTHCPNCSSRSGWCLRGGKILCHTKPSSSSESGCAGQESGPVPGVVYVHSFISAVNTAGTH